MAVPKYGQIKVWAHRSLQDSERARICHAGCRLVVRRTLRRGKCVIDVRIRINLDVLVPRKDAADRRGSFRRRKLVLLGEMQHQRTRDELDFVKMGFDPYTVITDRALD